MNTRKKRIGAVLLTVILGLAVTACADEPKDPQIAWQTAFQQTGDLLSGYGAQVLGDVSGGWTVLGLARSGRLDADLAEAYIQAANAYVADISSERLHSAKSTENSRIILALTAAGGDVTDVGGYDLLAGLTDMDYVTRQGNGGPIWALIAFDSGSYGIPTAKDTENQVTREALVAYILSAQCGDGGWGLTREPSEADMTAMALQALAPYRQDSEVAGAIDRGLGYLSAAQGETGGYESYGFTASESCAQVIVALTALGIDPAADSRFIKNGRSVLDALCDFAVGGGGFCHILEAPERSGVATEQGYYALTAYDRWVSGETSLYDMSE